MAHPLFGPELRQLLLDNDVDGLKTFCETLHPATVAETTWSPATLALMVPVATPEASVGEAG